MKKFIALLLSILMVFSVSAVAFAEDDVNNEETTVAEVEDEAADDTLASGFGLIGGFFEQLGNMLKVIFEFLSNLFNGTGDKNLDYI